MRDRAHRVAVDAFAIEIHQVTNEKFARFVRDTGYITVAERPLDPADFPGAPMENLQPGSMVFTPTRGPVDLRHLSQWWTWTIGASWQLPTGPGSTITGREQHPVVHVAHEDAAAYAQWAGRSSPPRPNGRPRRAAGWIKRNSRGVTPPKPRRRF
ncbi:SUMF1/EgtB/PvdO family nonheme iron enzyme [Rhodococcus sp. ZPP]|uniref:SUMF1/EgtB/PvdO family nonheme iron enzyme n=1 Tax=Rhodococcus sp. ZPP TaxID=2749906 RepID=UPI003298FAF8